MQNVQPAVQTHADLVALAVLALVGDLVHRLGLFVVIGKEGTAITESGTPAGRLPGC